jgi:hypothetical protein
VHNKNQRLKQDKSAFQAEKQLLDFISNDEACDRRAAQPAANGTKGPWIQQLDALVISGQSSGQ